VRLITDVTSTVLGKRMKWWYASSLFRTKSLKEEAMWHRDPLLGSDHEISIYTTAVSK
jgi:hypothetical protein